MEIKHWSEKIVEEVEARGRPFVVSSAITTSGSTHLGTLCEFLYPSAVYKGLLEKGHEATFYFQGDILDAFDKIPGNLKEHEALLKPHLGKPLSDVPDPFGCCKSYGEHFLNEAIKIMHGLDVHPTILRANEQYAKGLFDEHARFYLKNQAQAKEILERTSFRKVPADWSPLMVICAKCGKIATTRVTKVHGDEIEYTCDKDLEYTKGCAYAGKTTIGEHRYKLVWRLDWPAKQEILKVSVEGGGKDHFTRGGSRDSLEAIYREMFKKEPPVGFRFGFIMIAGQKYSKSKGIGLGVKEIMELVSPDLLKYILFKPPVEKDKDMVPTGDFILKAYDELFRTAHLVPASEADQKRAIAYKLAGGKEHKTSISDIILYYQLYKDWAIVKEKTGDAETVDYIKKYVENWLKEDMVPPNLKFTYNPQKIERMNEPILKFAQELKEGMSGQEIHDAAYKTIKENSLKADEFFKAIYETLIGKESGPKLGALVHAIGSSKVKAALLGLYA